MYYARVEAEFAAAHFLSRYHGKCERLHGHNYRALLWVRGADLDEGGMLVDFGLLKKALRDIAGGLDHTSLNDNPAFRGDPSAERIARYIFEKAEKLFKAEGLDPELLHAVEVYETPSSMARYERS
jgi:6-pyruvoyltetrahydropterin/6-carboxytetrahydropterin synthase